MPEPHPHHPHPHHPQSPAAYQRSHSDADVLTQMDDDMASERDYCRRADDDHTTAGAQSHLTLDVQLEDEAASLGANLLSPCTLGVSIAATSGESALSAASAPTNACSGVGQVLPAIGGVGDVKRINGHTMARLLRGEFRGKGEHEIDQFVVIDCRYDYEYAGGHIAGAININDRTVLSKFFRTHSADSTSCHRLAIIFHCEFSQNRAPKSYKFFRSLDRLRNQANYPHLSFPELCVLDGGYKQFVVQFPQHCARAPLASLTNMQPTAAALPSPSSAAGNLYVSMWAEEFQAECKSRTAAHRKSWSTARLLATDLLATPCVSAKKAKRSSGSPEDIVSSGHKKSPASRGLKRSAADGSPEPSACRALTPGGRSASVPTERGSGVRARTNLFAPFNQGGLFASPARSSADGDSLVASSSGASSRGQALVFGLSPLPSFHLLSADTTPHTPKPNHQQADRDVHMHPLQPVPFMMVCSPDKP